MTVNLHQFSGQSNDHSSNLVVLCTDHEFAVQFDFLLSGERSVTRRFLFFYGDLNFHSRGGEFLATNNRNFGILENWNCGTKRFTRRNFTE